MTRKLTTIIAADIAGFSRLVGLDEEAVLAEMQAIRAEVIDPLLATFGGRVANTAGDSLLIEFPSAVEAVRCALSWQDELAARGSDTAAERRIVYRIGINVGDVVSQGGDLLGDAVNIAARLEALAPPGGIVLSRSMRDQIRDRLDLELADLGDVEVKNIARPVRAFQIVGTGAKPAAPPKAKPRRFALALGAAAAVAVALGGIAAWTLRPDADSGAGDGLALPDQPSLVVLPFGNSTGADENGYLAEGIGTTVRTQLSKFPQLFIIAGGTAEAIDREKLRIRDIGQELGVRFVLEGSLQRGADGVAVTAELIETEREQAVWADSFQLRADEPFAVQDDIARQIVGTLRVVIEEDAVSRALAAPTGNPRAYDLYLRAMATVNALNIAGRLDAIRLLTQAIGIDPDFFDAHAELSGRYLSLWRFGGSETPDEHLRLARLHAREALRIDPTDYRAQLRSGMIHLFADHDHDLALGAFQRALDRNPNDADVLYYMGFLRSLMGDGAGAIAWNDRAKRVNPLYPGWYDFNAAMSHFLIRDYDRALTLARAGIAAYPKSLAPRRILIATLVEAGRGDDARAEAAAYMEIRPRFRLSAFRNTPFQKAADQERYFGALRLAGIPD